MWEHLKEQFQDLKATVMDAVMSMIQTQVIQAGIKWILGLLSPVGAFVKAALAIVDVVKFFMQRAAQIAELVDAFVSSVAAIASGKVGAVAKAIEGALGKAVPVLIGLLASILGIGGITDKVLGLIRKIRKRVTLAITNFWIKVKKGAGKLLRKLGGKVKGGVSKLIAWWKSKKKFKGDDGKKHTLFFKGSAEKAKLMVASEPKNYLDFLKGLKVPKENKAGLNIKINAKAKAKEVDEETSRNPNKKTDSKE